ncbi:ABC transporter permease [Lactococcus insecticola]|uniref:ABC transporter permease n=1 Tax=Pseudolactococcus insecticola TaxID=2709158 RepID=A0A6A0B786_9LACT|nr:FtsX-like permease family protein [Lactococcus insecticola]GFH40174.1 ABC transporter permease [Lactococcus insecticola]
MDFIRRAWLFTRAKIGRTVLLIVTFSAILIFVLSGLVINNSANQSIENAKKEAGATVTLAVDREAMMKKAQATASSSSSTTTRGTFDLTPVKLTDAQKIAALSGVKSYSFTKQTTATKGNITPITSTSSTTTSSTTETDGGGKAEFSGGGEEKQPSGDFQVIGTNNLKSVTAFSAGTNKITSGRALTTSDEKTNNVVIESDLATANSLKVGSTFTLLDSNSKSYTMTVVGIYKSSASLDSTAMSFSFMNVSNQIYSSLTFANTLAGTTGTVDSAVYNLTDPAKSAAFVKAADKLIDTTTYSVTSNDATYQTMLQPLNNVAKFARNIVLLVAVAGTIILSLIVILTIRERRGEIGILMSMGESRLKVIGQFFVELFIVMVVAVGIATASGNFVGNAVGSQLLESQTTATTTSTTTTDKAGGPQQGGAARTNPFNQSATQIKAIDKLNVKMSGKQIAMLGAIAFGIIVIAVVIASIGIIRLNPKEILTGA